LSYDIIIIGGGIIGLATGLKLKTFLPSLSVAILEKEKQIAFHQTGHNSGVIHSGLYYKPGSLKAINCVNGYNQLIEFCQNEGIPHEICGKIVVATQDQEIPNLEMLFERGSQNGLTNLKKLNQAQLAEYEPHVKGLQGIFVPQTGIVDFKIVSEKYAHKFRDLGGEIFCNEKLIEVKKENSHSLVTSDQKERETKLLVNCAGLYSDKVAQLTGEHPQIKIVPFRGEYYRLKKDKQHLVKNLIYPVPDPNFPFLGVHFTRMIHGGIEAGPNAVLAFRREGYKKSDINLSELVETLTWPGFQKVVRKYWSTGLGEMYRSFSKTAFTSALQKLLPELKKEDLETGGSGVRAQACARDGGLIDDFVIMENEQAINVLNAPSPAATSSLAIGEKISQLAIKRF